MTEEKILKTTRFEVGFFVRKVVDGQVVRQWQFPREKRRAIVPDPPRPVPQGGAAGGTEQSAAAEPAPQVRALALEAAAPEGAPSTDGSTDGSGDSSTTTYEVGFFVRTETVSPPDYGGDKGSEPPPGA